MYPARVSRILIIEDDTALAALIAEYLGQNGLEVSIESRGDRAVARILAEDPALVVLDVMLPGEDGLSICRRVRDRYHGPILIISARGEEVDQIIGLEVGADDYLPKPLNPRLLLARIRARLRERTQRLGSALHIGALHIDRGTREVRMDAQLLELTTGEFTLLWALAERAGGAVDRDTLSLAVRGAPYNGLDRTIDVMVSRLRRKLGAGWIKTVRGAGYQLIRPAR